MWRNFTENLLVYLINVATKVLSPRVQSIFLERFKDEVTCFLFGSGADEIISCFLEVLQNPA